MTLPIDESPLPDLAHVQTVHILGICGTAMGTFAGMLQAKGYTVSGSDAGVYPPMSTQLEALGIQLMEGYKPENLDHQPDLVIVGNVIRRTNPEAEAMRARGMLHTSFPRALGALFLDGKHPVVIAGTHGKTTTTAIAAHLLHHAGLDPTFLVGGIPLNFGASYRVGSGPHVVLEGDEYDTAYFDKVPKFKHYQPQTSVLTSVEFDHADIYDDLAAVEDAFDLLSELTAANRGTLLPCAADRGAMDAVGRCPTGLRLRPYGGAEGLNAVICGVDALGYHLSLSRAGEALGDVLVPMYGRHNVLNALAAYEVGASLGIQHRVLASGLATFSGVKRRMEWRGTVREVIVFDDFAHHPTAVKTTLEGVRERHPDQRILAVFEPRSATSCRKVFQAPYEAAFGAADVVWISANARAAELPEAERFLPEDLVESLAAAGADARFGTTVEAIVAEVAATSGAGDVVVVMSNGSFGDIHRRLLDRLAAS
jgi:UDP-N-acetylmuramate: L-alanyl-gamma-D-glutamyl-meso-diaminopimelate ligase